MTGLPLFTGKTGIKCKAQLKVSGAGPGDTHSPSTMLGYGEQLAWDRSEERRQAPTKGFNSSPPGSHIPFKAQWD